MGSRSYLRPSPNSHSSHADTGKVKCGKETISFVAVGKKKTNLLLKSEEMTND